MKIVAYLRVSTDKQAEEGYGLDVQRADCQAWARANGHRIVGWYPDEGVGGANDLAAREKLPDALAALADGTASALVVPRLDRLARDLVVQESLIAEIRRMGGEIFSTSAAEAGYLADDPDDPSRKLIRQILGAVNEYEKAMIALRLRRGRAAKHRAGGYAYGAPAYGQRAQDGQLADEPAEQAVSAEIAAMRATGASYRAIAAHLNDAGHTTKRGTRWRAPQVQRVAARLAG